MNARRMVTENANDLKVIAADLMVCVYAVKEAIQAKAAGADLVRDSCHRPLTTGSCLPDERLLYR